MSTPTEIKISGKTRLGAALRYSYKVLVEDKQDTVIMRGAGSAIPTLVSLAELIRHRIQGLHQTTEITTLDVQNEGYDKPRTLIMLKVILSHKPLDVKHVGYSKPLPASEV